MMNYFEYRTINELIDDKCNCYRQLKEFTLDELAQYDGKNGMDAYVAIGGIVYDVSDEPAKYIEIIAGKDLTEQLNFYYRMIQIINKEHKIGVINYNNDMECENNKLLYEQEEQDVCQLKSDKWRNYDGSLEREGMNRKNKKVTKKSCQYQMPVDMLAELEQVFKETINRVLELQIEMLKCTGTTTNIGIAAGGVQTIEETGVKKSGFTGLAGGAVGGDGGGLGVISEIQEKIGEPENKSTETEKNLGPGAVGGAAGGALGSV